MKYLALKIEYDGTAYSGWQFQKNVPSVQDEIEAVSEKLCGQRLKLMGSGRTDAGVHALGQVASAILEDFFTIPEDKIKIAFNSELRRDIKILGAKILDKEFHARFHAMAREYSYTLGQNVSVFDRHHVSNFKLPFDRDMLIESGPFFVGKYDFTSFSKNNPSTKKHVCNVSICEWTPIQNGKLRLEIKADRFLYGMVRSIVGAMLLYARGKLSEETIMQLLANPDGYADSPLAPPQGLILERVHYPDHFDLGF